jgi:predicted N-acyltransferase
LDLEAAQARFCTGMAEIPPAQWNRLAGTQPMLRHAFLHALEASGSVGLRSGWQARHLSLWRGDRLIAAMPLYLKSHSYGEYVFDWSWANAHEQLGQPYYPKLLCAIPFTPVPGKRLLAETLPDRRALAQTARAFAREAGLSSLHCLFPDQDADAVLSEAGLMQRRGYQFHWNNPGYASFEDFLATLTRDKRKKIRQERRKVADAGIHFERLSGKDIRENDWAFFYRCYVNTYREHRSTPYLNLDFFHRLADSMPGNLMLVLAWRDGTPIASAFNLFDGERLYGRYWGALDYVPGLHFETCYYQGMEFCIDHGLKVFEGGAQGEHKLARGFLPVITHSRHWLADARIGAAVCDFLLREGRAVEDYLGEMEGPFRPGGPA